jgi:hypothetical protein
MPITKPDKVRTEWLRMIDKNLRCGLPARKVFGTPILLLLVLIFCAPPAYTQRLDPESNWYKETGRRDDWYSHFDFAR